MDLFSIILALGSAIILFVLFSKWRYQYWLRKGIPQLDPKLFFGDYKPIFTGSVAGQIHFRNMYERAKAKGLKHVGIYSVLIPELLVLDLNTIKSVLLKDFDHFHSHGIYRHEKEPVSINLLSLDGDEWKKLRIKLSPTFTTGKMKMMFETLLEKSINLKRVMNSQAESEKEIQIKETLSRFGTDVIGSVAFGIECNSLEEPKNKFREIGKEAVRPTIWHYKLENLIPHNILGNLGYRMFPKGTSAYFTNIVKETIKYRETTNIQRKDFMQIMLQLKNQEDETMRITEQEIINEAYLFFLAGFETTSTTSTFALLELAHNQDIQNKLRQEIFDSLKKNDGNITYDLIMQLPYLDQVIHETLRKYPPIPFLPRVCTKSYTLPGSDIVIQKGTGIYIPVWGIQMDAEYYPNPEVFNPENFSLENKSKRPDFTWMPFGEGPRICIGMRFGLLQSKMAVITMLSNFKFSLGEKTPYPIELDKSSAVLAVKGDVWLKVEKL